MLLLVSDELNFGNCWIVLVRVFSVNVSGVIDVVGFCVFVLSDWWNVLSFVIFVLLKCVTCGIFS